MKNKLFLMGILVMVLAFSVGFIGCSSSPTVYDKSVPLDQSSTIRINNAGQINNFNGERVFWNSTDFGQKMVTIPAGKHTFGGWFVVYLPGGSQLNISFSNAEYDFLPGHTYFIFGCNLRGAAVNVIDETALNKELVPDTMNPNASPIEGRWVNINNDNDQIIFAGNEYISSDIILSNRYFTRGIFFINGSDVYIVNAAVYHTNKKIYIPSSDGNFTRYTYDGTLLTRTHLMRRNDEYKRIE